MIITKSSSDSNCLIVENSSCYAEETFYLWVREKTGYVW